MVANTTTDSTGYYTLSVSGGTYNVRVTPPAGSGFQTAIALNRIISGDTALDFVLVPSGVAGLSGRIQDRFGNGLSGVQLYLSASGGGSEISVVSDNTGAYAFQVAPGDYTLRLYSYDYAAAFNAPRYFALYVNAFTLSANTIADITIPAQQVTVHVQDAAGHPVANAAINTNQPYAPGLNIGPFTGEGYSAYQMYLPAAMTDAGGDAVMWLFPSNPNYGTYTLTATPPSGSPFVTFNITNVSISSDKDIVVVLQFVHDAPVTTADLSPSSDVNGEYPDSTAVMLSATALSGFTVAATYYSVDAGSTQTYSAPFTVSGVGPHTIRYWSVDNSGVFELSNTRTFTIRSNTPPVALYKNVTVQAGANCTANASVDDGSFDMDAGDTITIAQTPAGPYPLGETTVTLTVTDSRGDSSSGQAIVTVLDTTAPELTPPANVVVTLPANSTATSMAVSFPDPVTTDNCSVPTLVATPTSGSEFPVGTTTVNLTATDGAGNQTTGSFTVTVLYNFIGFFQPVDNLPTTNVAKAGSAIPVKWSLAGYRGMDIFAAGYPASGTIPCESTSDADVIEQTVTAGASSLNYDAAVGQYIYVWKTEKAWAGTCRQLVIKLNDDTYRRANFKFTK